MAPAPIILFGAFDRHNLGDLLLAQCAQASLAGRPCVHAGLQARDLREFGGPRVEALNQLLADWPARFGKAPLDILHVGGEILSTSTWEAALMLQEPAAVDALLRRLSQDSAGAAWAQAQIGAERPLAYVLNRSQCPLPIRHLEFRCIGGCTFAALSAAERAYGLQALAEADRLSVRDRVTQAALAEAGLQAQLSPDPVSGVSRRFAAQIHQAGQDAAVLAALHQAGGPFLAVQFAAEYAADATLAQIAARLNAQGRSLVLFRAGAAPWHDDLEPYQRLLTRLRVPAQLFGSLHIWAICALLAASAGVFATSLHVRLLAREFGHPLLDLPDGMRSAKVTAYEASWYPPAGQDDTP
ncbi:polysaccharide pyruvyl transferase family protein [Pseudomonas sp.]|uniref:polysaccharide pyruvyl transferase family protein n=1 Tax=Pseudomonas sp. TaxID=306 RepID=UPI002734F53E|nr:polysaccharide pyruvyl transferase family protein [Pseudomonas sp.]MDP3813685.1 polysaccharide pyruvyl transferase family protein [Pseudomonas sp.]